MLDESALRRPAFLDGADVRLADGGIWTFPLPPKDRGSVSSKEEYEARCEALFGNGYVSTLRYVIESEDGLERLKAELALGILLLDRNYKLDSVAFRLLLEFPPRDPALGVVQNALHEIAGRHVDDFRLGPPILRRSGQGISGLLAQK
jgi:hypothetical protein